MEHQPFDEWTEAMSNAGQRRLAAITAAAVAERAPALDEALRGAGAAPYLQPELFAFLGLERPTLPLE
ncbi:MAG: hypothetical protein AB1Z98_01735 [Nannocystaceae bacterium]